MRVLVLNPHSSSGKTTTALNLSLALAREGVSVQIFDMDPRGTLSHTLEQSGLLPAEFGARIAGASLDRVVLNVSPYVSVHALGRVEAVAGETTGSLPASGGAWQIIDTNSASVATHAALIAESDAILVPVRPDPAVLEDLNELVSDLSAVGMPQSALRLLIAQYSNRISGHRIVRAKLIERFGSQAIAPVVIRTTTRLSTTGAIKGSIFQNAPRSTGASDFAQLARSFLSEHALGTTK